MQPKPHKRGRRLNENEYEDKGNGVTVLRVAYRPKPPSEPQTVTALIDTADCARVQAHNWTANPAPGGKFYLRSRIGGRYVYLHRFIMNCLPGFDTDHFNRDPLDNRKTNLRNVTRAENLRNRVSWAKGGERPAATEAAVRAMFPCPPPDLNLSKVPKALARIVQFAFGLNNFFLDRENPGQLALKKFSVSVNGSAPLYPVTAVKRAVNLWHNPSARRDCLRNWAKQTLNEWLARLLDVHAEHLIERDKRGGTHLLTCELTTGGGEIFGSPSWYGFLPNAREVARAMKAANKLEPCLIWAGGGLQRGYRGVKAVGF